MRLHPRFSLLAVCCVAILLASRLLPAPQNGAIAGLPSVCPFHNLTGLPCPGCGLTRAFVCCAHGDLSAAFTWHPLGPILFAAAAFFVGFAIIGRQFPPITPRVWKVVALLFGAVWVLRLGGVFALPST